MQERTLECVEAAFDFAASCVQAAGAFGLLFLICLATGCCNGEHAQVPVAYAPSSATALNDYEWAYVRSTGFFTDHNRYLYMHSDTSTRVEETPLILVKTPDGFELFAEKAALAEIQIQDYACGADWRVAKLHIVDDLDRLDFDKIAKTRQVLEEEGPRPIVLEDTTKPIWWTKSMTVYTEEEGIAAIRFLQGLADVPETEEQARRAWNSFSDTDKESTMQFYKRLKPREDAKEIAQELIASSPGAQQRVTNDQAR